MLKRYLSILLLSCSFLNLIFSQNNSASFTPASERIAGYEQRKTLLAQSLVAKVPFRSIGPSVFSGRVADIAVNPHDPTHFYVAYASGGLWYTENNGQRFTPVFDHEAVMSIGDIAVDWDQEIIWVGTGENNSSRSSYSGLGMYKSTDGGKSWEHRGLEESHHIGRIILHPSDPDILWVAVLGHLYSPNRDRGIYKSMDGGKSWKQVLYVNDDTGGIDLILDPDNPDILYGATWERTRRAWDFVESGQGSGIYKSVDGGENWQLLSTPDSKFPTGEGVGRIGLALTKENGRPILYAILDNYFRRPEEEKEEEKSGLSKDDLREMEKEQFLTFDLKDINKFLRDNRFPKQYTAERVRTMVEKDSISPVTLIEYLEDANSLLFDTPVIGAEIYRSDDGGRQWIKQNDYFLDGVYNSYGYYFGQIQIAPQHSDHLYILGVPILKSKDAGHTWESINGDNVHADHHALWVNPNRAGHLILGNDGGINISYDDGETWIKCNSPALGQFYAIAVDMDQPYNVYGGLQDNGVWVGPSSYEASDNWHDSGQYPYKRLLGGDGMQVAVDTRDNRTIYTGYQFGFYFRIDRQSGKRVMVRPRHELGERPFRFNWQTPIHLSVHHQDILYFGANKLFRSLNKGKDLVTISDDLTKGGRKGDVPYGTLSAIHESPLKFGLLYTGSDDGLIYVSRDGGEEWKCISNDLPQNKWISEVIASSHAEGRVYAALNGYREDDFNPYIYSSEDYGQTWLKLGLDLPKEPVNVIKEDPHNPDLLYVGTDHGLYLSLDRGQRFMQLKKGLPAVAVHDVVVHPRERDLIVGTHGRSIYVTNIAPVQQMNKVLLDKEIHVFALAPVDYRTNWGNSRAKWAEVSIPKISIPVYSKSAGPATLLIESKKGLVLKIIEIKLDPGLNYPEYDLSIDDGSLEDYKKEIKATLKEEEELGIKEADNGVIYLQKGKYRLVVKKNEKVSEQELLIE